MDKTTHSRYGVKRKLIHQLNNANSSRTDEASKRMRSTDQDTTVDDQTNPRSTDTGIDFNRISQNNDLIVRIVNKGGQVRSVTQKEPKPLARVQRGQRENALDHDKHPQSKKSCKPSVKLKSKIVVPSKQTRSRVIKPPARFLDNSSDSKQVTSKKVGLGNKKGSKIKILDRSKIDLEQYNALDFQTDSEIADGNAAAGRSTVDHDGIELSVNGSDLDEFSDDENNNLDQTGEPGEILTSEDEQVDNTQSVAVTVHRSSGKDQSVQKVNKLDKFKHLRNDPDFNEFLDQVLDRKLSDKTSGSNSTAKGAKVKGTVNSIFNVNQNATCNPKAQQQGVSSVSKPSNHTPQVRNLIKSPSDTTLYTPGLQKGNANSLINGVSDIEKISNFVESIRIDNSTNSGRHSNKQKMRTPEFSKKVPDRTPSTSAARSKQIHDAHQKEDEQDAERDADQLILQAENFKARVEAPRGRNRMSGGLN